MYSPQDIASIISKAQRQAAVEAAKIRRDDNVVRDTEVVHSCKFDGERMAVLERQVEEIGEAINGITQALSVFNEELSKAQGMLKFCYAICQNPAIKDLADANRGAARGPLGALSFGKFGGNRGNDSHGGGSAGPRPGLGSAARP